MFASSNDKSSRNVSLSPASAGKRFCHCGSGALTWPPVRIVLPPIAGNFSNIITSLLLSKAVAAALNPAPPVPITTISVVSSIVSFDHCTTGFGLARKISGSSPA